MDPELFLHSNVNYLDVLRVLDEGVIITDAHGRIVFMNAAQARIDGVDPDASIGKRPSDIWDVTDDTSVTLRCLRTGQPMINQYLAYRTRTGRLANTINSVFPLRTASGLVGSISFVRGYNLMEETIASICSVIQSNGHPTSVNGTRFTFQDIVGESPVFMDSIKTAKMAAFTKSPVMLHGDTGTGKELFAQSMHNYGPRKLRHYLGLNCAAIPENLLEGLLFGTAKGAFTGAADKPGLFEKANGGTLFLDEVNSMPLGLQAKLLRVVQEMRVRRVGSLEEREIDVKLLSSMNEDPHLAIQGQRLRLDLFFRLGVVMLHIPSLKERGGDFPLLTRFFIDKYNQDLGRHVAGISAEVERLFQAYPWPGNVRELEHVIEGAMNVVGEGTVLEAAQLPHYLIRAQRAAEAWPESPAAAPPWRTHPRPSLPMPPPIPEEPENPRGLLHVQAAAERQALERALVETRGNLSRAAGSLGISRQRLSYRMAKHGLERQHYLAQRPRKPTATPALGDPSAGKGRAD